jgi:hypothetical protein
MYIMSFHSFASDDGALFILWQVAKLSRLGNPGHPPLCNYQEVLLKSFPMNGHVSSDNPKFWGQFLCVLSLMTEIPNSPEFK